MNTQEGRPRPYVGVSGVVNEQRIEPNGIVWYNPQSLLLEKMADDAGLFVAGRDLVLGVKAMYTALLLNRQIKRNGKPYGEEWYPVGERQLSRALAPKGRNEHVRGVAQVYAGPHPYNDGNAGHYQKFIREVVRCGGPWIDTIQFDGLRWYDNNDALQFVADTKRAYSEQGMNIILQCGREAMAKLEPDGVVRKLGQYAAGIDYILFDASEGVGRRMQLDVMDDFLDAAYSSEALSGVGCAIAGGLNADAVQEDLPYLLQKYPDLSWDAEGKLHPLNNMGTRPIQMEEAKKYLQSSVEVVTNN